ncbi:hypothetical protein V866_002221 [Kwoniella sp. B9012]
MSQVFSDLRSIQTELQSKIAEARLEQAKATDRTLKARCDVSEETNQAVLSYLQYDSKMGKELEEFIQRRLADEYTTLTSNTRATRGLWGGKLSWTTNVDLQRGPRDCLVVNVDLRLQDAGKGKTRDYISDTRNITQTSTRMLLQMEMDNPPFTWGDYDKIKVTPEYINRLQQRVSSCWIESNKNTANCLTLSTSVRVLHDLGPQYESYIQSLGQRIMHEIFNRANTITIDQNKVDSWVRQYSEKAIRKAWDHCQTGDKAYYKLRSTFKNMAKYSKISRETGEGGKSGTKVATPFGDCGDGWFGPSDEHVFSEWIDDDDLKR